MCRTTNFVPFLFDGDAEGASTAEGTSTAEGVSTADDVSTAEDVSTVCAFKSLDSGSKAEGAAGDDFAAILALFLEAGETEGVSTASKDAEGASIASNGAEDAPPASKDAADALVFLPSQLTNLFASFLNFLCTLGCLGCFVGF